MDFPNLHLGDCLSIMRTMPDESVDLVLTSPPYNLGNYNGSRPNFGSKSATWKSKTSIANGYSSHDDAMPFDDYVAWQHDFLRECWRLIPNDGAIFYNHKPRSVNKSMTFPTMFVPPELPVRSLIIWSRGNGMNFNPAYFTPSHEWIIVLAKPDWKLSAEGNKMLDVWNITPEQKTKHPAPFPLELARKAIKATNAKTVLDPFMGSGTTGVAALLEGRKFSGIELDPEYFNAASIRIDQTVLLGA